jgi:hypothetical protein
LRSPARAALATRHAPPSLLVPFLDGRLQPHLDEVQHRAIDHASSDTLQQLLVRDGVEIFRQVRVDHLRIAVAQSPMHRLDRVLSTPARAIAIRTRVELRFEDRFQYKLCRGLHHPVPNRRDAEWTLAAATGFGNQDPTHGRRAIGLRLQLISQRCQPRVDPLRVNVREGFSINPRCPTLRTGQSVGVLKNIFTMHLVVQQIEPVLGRLFRFDVQLPLKPPDAIRSRQAHANLRVLGLVGSTQK